MPTHQKRHPARGIPGAPAPDPTPDSPDTTPAADTPSVRDPGSDVTREETASAASAPTPSAPAASATAPVAASPPAPSAAPRRGEGLNITTLKDMSIQKLTQIAKD